MKRIIILLSACALLCGCAREAKTGNEKPQAYASFYAVYDFARTIAGDDMDVYNIVPVGSEPHDFEPTAADMAKLSEADIFIYHGAGMDLWAEDVIKTLPESVTVICASDGIAYDHSQNDPHLWLSPGNAKKELETICSGMERRDGANGEKYRERLGAYASEIDAADKEYSEAGLKGKTLFVTHGAYGYLCADYGMKQEPLEGITGDSDPSPAQMADIIDKLIDDGAGCIFYDPLEGDKAANAAAKEAGAEALSLYTFEGDDMDRDYVTVMRANLEQLKKIH